MGKLSAVISTHPDRDGHRVVIKGLKTSSGTVKAEIRVSVGGWKWVGEGGLEGSQVSLTLPAEAADGGTAIHIPGNCAQDIGGSPWDLTIQDGAARHGPFSFQARSGSARTGGSPSSGHALRNLAIVLVAALAAGAVYLVAGRFTGGTADWSRERTAAEVRRLLEDTSASPADLIELGSRILNGPEHDLGLTLLNAAADRGDPAGWLAVGRFYDPRPVSADRQGQHQSGRADLALHNYRRAAGAGSEAAGREFEGLLQWLRERAEAGDDDAARVLDDVR